MRRLTYAVIVGAVALSLTGLTLKLLAGTGCDAKAAGAGKSCPMAAAAAGGGKACPMAAAAAGGAGKSCGMMGEASGAAAGSMCVTGHVMGSACAAKSALSGLVKEAPGTRTEFVNVDNGVSLVVTAASAEYVAAVQSVVAREIENRKNMKAGTPGACAHGEAVGEGAAAGTEKAAAHSCAGMKGEAGAGVEKAGMKCCAGKGGQAASCNTGSCPEWMCTLGCARLDVSNTAGGVTLTWTTDKPENVDLLRKAGQQFQAEMSKL